MFQLTPQDTCFYYKGQSLCQVSTVSLWTILTKSSIAFILCFLISNTSPQFPLVASVNMSRSFCVISAVFLRLTTRGSKFVFFMNSRCTFIFQHLMNFRFFGCELYLELIACVAFVVSLIRYAISGIWMCMLNYVLNKLYVQYTKANCQHLYIIPVSLCGLIQTSQGLLLDRCSGKQYPQTKVYLLLLSVLCVITFANAQNPEDSSHFCMLFQHHF